MSRMHIASSRKPSAEGDPWDDAWWYEAVDAMADPVRAQEFIAERDLGEQRVFKTYVRRICDLDADRLLYGIIWSEFSGSVRLLLDNRFVFKPFWESQSGRLAESEWEALFQAAKSKAKRAIETGDTAGVLNPLFSRLYTLRNQIVHGGSTWKSAANRAQLKDGVRILERLIPTIISVMMDHPGEVWGAPSYPVVN